MALSTLATILGLLNGIIGGTILVLPILGLQAGYLMIIVSCCIMGLSQGYTAYLIVLHLGKSQDINISIQNHFQGDFKYSIMYNVLMCFTFLPGLIIFFKILCLQLQALFSPLPYLPVLAVFALFCLTLLLRRFNFGERFLAYGGITIFIYFLFITWSQFTAPTGSTSIKPIESNPFSLISPLLMAYSVHGILVQVIIQNPNRQQYPKIIFITFLIAILVYIYFAFGCYAIVNRSALVPMPQTITNYFDAGSWQIIIVQIIYAIHMLSVFPENIIVCRKRFSQLLLEESQEQFHSQIKWSEPIFYIIILSICYVIYTTNIELTTLISINGAFVCFFCNNVLPIWIHFKCVFYDHSSGQFTNKQYMLIHSEGKAQVQRNYDSLQQDNVRNNCQHTQLQQNACECEVLYRNRFTLCVETVLLVAVLLGGFYITYNTIANILSN